MDKESDGNDGFIALVKSDAQRWHDTPNMLNFLALFFLQPGFQLAFSLRVQQSVSAIPVLGPLLRKVIWYMTCAITSCHCSPRASYGGGLYVPHPSGIVIGDGVQIGNNVTVYQGVSLGGKDVTADTYPVIGDHVTLCAGSQVLGAVHVAKNATVGGNAVVLKDVPEGASAVGVPARILKKST